MPRYARCKSETGIYHIMLRGINGQRIFEEKEDAEKFLYILKKCKNESCYRLYAYCLMGNHIHLLIKEERENLASIIKRIGASYVYWYNNKYERTGPLFQGRYKSEPVEDESYLLTVLRYIHQNPTKAGLLKDLKEYKWSSYREYNGSNTFLIDKDFILDMLSENKVSALEIFEDIHLKEVTDDCLDVEPAVKKKKMKMDEEAIEAIKRVCGIDHCTALQKFEREERNVYLRKLKQEGFPIRQISRLTGISRNVITKA